jgi:hypothetical protein
MKKSLLILVFAFFVLLSGFSQVKEIDFSRAKHLGENSGVFQNYEELMYYKAAYFLTYPLTPVGLKHCLDKLKKILSVNNLAWSNTLVDYTQTPKNIDGSLQDYIPLNASLQAEYSEVNKTWALQNQWHISLNLVSKAYTIWLIPATDKK